MQYQEDEEVRLSRRSSREAIALAMEGRWREAIAANRSIISNSPNDVNAHNRLGRAYMELGEYSQAREAYRQALEVDPYNVIAKKNLDRLSQLGEPAASSEVDSRTAEPHHFIEEVGKAGVLNLHRLASPEILAGMVAGNKVYLKIDGTGLIVENSRGEYLGEIEPKYAQRLIKLMGGGNKYAAAIISSTENTVNVIIREVYQDSSQAGQLSFPPRGFEEHRTSVGDRMIKRELEYEETAVEELGYTIIDNEGTEIPLTEHLGNDEEDRTEGEE
ncbi:tetratricopeptide repeat protein [Chloroflexota bacterium]